MNKTKIPWVLNPDGTPGFTSNPVRGKCPVDCSYCYVKPLRKRFGWSEFLTFHKEELDAIRKRQKPSGIFVGSVMELFHENTIGVMPEIIQAIKDCPHHRFYLLTKQPQNLIKFSPFPDNCYVGVTATNPQMFYEAQEYLEKIIATVCYISLEPFLERIWTPQINAGILDWLIIGSQTKPYRPPTIEAVREIVESCDKAGIPVFLKNNLKPLINTASDKTYSLLVNDNWELRQEMPR